MDSKTRFSNRVEDYVKYRPHYPAAIIPFLEKEYGLSHDQPMADIGAGTGISTAMFLQEGYEVYAVEPNADMLSKAVELLQQYPAFHAVDGTAENTTLPDGSMGAVIAGQAFHWFDQEKCKAEFKRILRPEGVLVLMWNERKTESPFEKDYDAFIVQHGKDYVKVDHRNVNDEDIARFFAPAPMQLKIFPNEQIFDFEGLKGRLLSSSYMPARDEEGYEPMISGLKDLFDKYKENELIRIGYDTKVYVGTL